jgi:hypothetical protein
MLENLAGKEGVPSLALVRDLRTLCRMKADQLQVFANAFEKLPEDLSTESIKKILYKVLTLLEGDPELLVSSAQVALFLWDKWSSRRLSKEQIVSDLKGLDIDESAMKNVMPLLDAMQKRIQDLRKFKIESSVLSTGTPKIDTATCVIDGRAVFKSAKYEDELNDNKEYYQIDHFVPIATLEIISKLNDEETTHSFLLNETDLDDLKDILDRASKRLAVVKESLITPKQKELSFDEKRKQYKRKTER